MKLNKNILLIVLLVALVLGGTYWYNNMSAQASFNIDMGGRREGFEGYSSVPHVTHNNGASIGSNVVNDSPIKQPQKKEDDKPTKPKVEMMTNESDCQPRDTLSPEELLPQDYSSTWAKCNPTGAGNLDGKNFLDAGWHVGINTVGQSLRNANLSLRSDPYIKQVVISPFLQSTIQPDTNRRHFEIGSC
jgi:hypothetical protein